MYLQQMMDQVRHLHEERGFRANGGEDPVWRVALLTEEVGELAAAITKGEGEPEAELADILICVLGTCVALHVDIEAEFKKKMAELRSRRTVIHQGHVRLAREAWHPKTSGGPRET